MAPADRLSSAHIPAGEVLAHHQCYLENDSMVKFPQIQASQLLDLLQAVHQGIAVYEELSGGFGHIQIVLKELIDGEQGFLIQAVNGVLLEYLAEEDLTQGSGQLVDQPANA